MATEEVGVVELRVRGNEVCLSHPRRSKAMCRGCLRPCKLYLRLCTLYIELEAQRMVEPTFTDTIHVCIVIETRFCPILSARTKPPRMLVLLCGILFFFLFFKKTQRVSSRQYNKLELARGAYSMQYPAGQAVTVGSSQSSKSPQLTTRTAA